jgi:hypothetical protein
MKVDFLRVGVRGRGAKSLKGLDGTPDRCALLCSLMAKVELRKWLKGPKALSSWSVGSGHLDHRLWRIWVRGVSIPFAYKWLKSS